MQIFVLLFAFLSIRAQSDNSTLQCTFDGCYFVSEMAFNDFLKIENGTLDTTPEEIEGGEGDDEPADDAEDVVLSEEDVGEPEPALVKRQRKSSHSKAFIRYILRSHNAARRRVRSTVEMIGGSACFKMEHIALQESALVV